MADILYRKALATDMEYLLWLRKETMNEHLVNAGILLNDEEHLLRINYLFDQTQIIISGRQTIGVLKVDENENHVEIVQIQIEPKYQGKGIGKQVIKRIIENSGANNKDVTLSVLKENRAKELYLSMGFKITGEDDTSFIMALDKQSHL